MTKFLVLCLALATLAACKISDDVALERSFNPLTCKDKSSNECVTSWIFSFARENYPENMQIVLNDEVIIDDCDPNSQWSKTSGRYVEYLLRDYVNFKCDKTFKLKIMGTSSCNTKFKMHSEFAEQSCVRKLIHGKQEVWVERN